MVARQRGRSMMLSRALVVIAIAAGMTVHDARAQFGDMPGMSGSPGAGGFSGPPAAPPPKCQALLAIRDELQKHGEALSAANDKKADVKVACRLFKNYIATEAKMIQMLDADGPSCGVPLSVNERVRGSHGKAKQIGKQVCDAAGPPRPLIIDPMPFKMGGLRQP
jgi:hypothetical protein